MGAASRAGRQKAKSSSRSKASRKRGRSSRRAVAGACTSIGGGSFASACARPAPSGGSSNSPSGVSSVARPAPATRAGASGNNRRGACGRVMDTLRSSVRRCAPEWRDDMDRDHAGHCQGGEGGAAASRQSVQSPVDELAEILTISQVYAALPARLAGAALKISLLYQQLIPELRCSEILDKYPPALHAIAQACQCHHNAVLIVQCPDR